MLTRRDDGTAGVVNWNEVKVPDTVWGVLAERIDRLPAGDKRVIQNASIVGRVFWEGLVSELAQLQARSHLEALDTRDFVYQLGSAAFAEEWEWMFHHVLVQEVAYSGLLKETRKAGHLLAARWLEQQVGDRRAEYATLLAHHYQLSGDWPKTAEFAEIAGDRAATIFAYPEAKLAYLQALEALGHLVVGEETRRRQVGVTVRLARVALYTPTDDVRQALEAAKQYADELGDGEGRVRIIAGMAAWLYAAGQARPAVEMAMQAVAGARAAGLEELLAVPFVIVARAMFIMGEYQQCVEMLEQSNALLEKYGIDFDDPARYGFLGAAYSLMGEIEKGEALCLENLRVAERQQNVRRVAAAHLYLGAVHCALGRLPGAGQHLQAAAQISSDTGDVALKFASFGFLGHWHAQRGELEDAARCLDTAIRLAAELDSQLNLGLWLAYRADVEIREGQAEAAVARAEQAVSVARETRQRPHEAEARRVLGWALHYASADRQADAAEELRRAADLHGQTRARPNVARTLYDLAAYLRLVGDDAGAAEAEAQASEVARELHLDWFPVVPPAPRLVAESA